MSECLDYSSIDPEWKEIFDQIPDRIKAPIDTIVAKHEEMFSGDLEVLPAKENRLATFKHVKPSQVKLVIFGQDPYIHPEQAMGLSFSVPRGVKIPPSLKNMYVELSKDIDGFVTPKHGDLTGWTEQGVLLLNSALTTLQCSSNKHQKEWRPFTNEFIRLFSEKYPDVVYILWGNPAKEKKKIIGKNGVFVEGTHPSPLSANNPSAPFFGGKYFSKANEHLKKLGKEPVDWRLATD